MRGDDGAPDEQAGDDERSHGGEEEGEHGRDDEAEQRLAVGEGASEEHDGLVGGPEDVEEAPGAEDAEKDEERERVRQERGREGEGDDGGVVDAEVAEVAAQARGGLGEGVRAREGRPVQQLRPGAPVRERAPRRVGQPAHEEAEGRRGERSVGEDRAGGRRGAAAAGGRRVGHGEQRRRRRRGGHGACLAESIWDGIGSWLDLDYEGGRFPLSFSRLVVPCPSATIEWVPD
ncbi:hypothetical protein HU200_004871 [Digitaria exilis]|uniref:Uncharacterized protein n=1 Tax=Digitaria exilis TaxID=1010633 RepID=A0A835FTE1_9POAL|nr:hypothetical protein HU200_004871 [Digitaria exilis]